MQRQAFLNTVRTALGRAPGQSIPAPPAPTLRSPEIAGRGERVRLFKKNLEALAGHVHIVADEDAAKDQLLHLIGGRSTVASNSPLLARCGFASVPRESLRAACATSDVGVTGADYALAATGTLVMLSSAHEARMISLLPPVHIAVVHASAILTNLDELFATLPRPAEQTSSMVMITGPSRTADIEQILVRGVHGPGEIHVIVIEPAGEDLP